MKKALFQELLASVEEMAAIEAGRAKPRRITRGADLLASDVRALRASFKLSQSKFAALLGISVDTLQNWEQGRRQPDGPAKVLLRVAATHPAKPPPTTTTSKACPLGLIRTCTGPRRERSHRSSFDRAGILGSCETWYHARVVSFRGVKRPPEAGLGGRA